MQDAAALSTWPALGEAAAACGSRSPRWCGLWRWGGSPGGKGREGHGSEGLSGGFSAIFFPKSVFSFSPLRFEDARCPGRIAALWGSVSARTPAVDVRWRFAKRSDTEPGLVSIKTVDCDRRHLPIVCPWPLGLLRGQEEQLLFFFFSNSGACLKQQEEEEEEWGLGLCFGQVFPFCGACGRASGSGRRRRQHFLCVAAFPQRSAGGSCTV